MPDTDRYTDIGVDATYQYANGSPSAFTLNASYIHEDQSRDGSFRTGGAAVASNRLNTLRLDATYTRRQTWSAGAGVFAISGGSDTTFYAPGPVYGSSSGSPDTRGYIVQLEYVPFGKGQHAVQSAPDFGPNNLR